MTEELDLFGHPVMQRAAEMGANRLRWSLSRTWGPGPRAFVLGCNPAEANDQQDDATTRWWISWFRFFGFGGFVAGNLYPFVSADPGECRKRADAAMAGQDWYDRDAMFENLRRVAELAKAADQVFVCYGAIAWDWDWIEHALSFIQDGDEPWPDLFCWGTTASGAPKHPMARGKSRISPAQQPILWRAAA